MVSYVNADSLDKNGRSLLLHKIILLICVDFASYEMLLLAMICITL